MAVSLPNGSTVSIGAVGSSLDMTAISNATAAVATLEASHGVVVGDYLRITSGWSRLTDKIVRVSAVATNDVTLEGYNTSDTDVYPAGSGIGSVEKVTGWTQLTQILQSTTNGGEQQFLEYQFLEADAQKRIPTFKSAAGITFMVADDPTLAGYIAASVANDDRAARPVLINLANQSKILYNCYVSLNKTPTMTVNELMACEVTMSMLNEPVRYAS